MADQPQRWRGIKNLILDVVEGTTDLVEATQDSVGDTTVAYLSLIEGLGEPARRVNDARRAISHLVNGTVRTGSRAVRRATDLGSELVPDEPTLPAIRMALDEENKKRFAADALLGVVNGLVGDHLRERENELDLGMRLRFEDRYFVPSEAPEVLPEAPSGRVVLFVHGLMGTEAFWALNAEKAWGAADVNYATKLRAERGWTPLFLRYNTGPHISENGRALSALLDRFCEYHPNTTELVLVGHSLGGLVSRSATHYASEASASWLDKLSGVATLGSPHLGSPVAEGGQLLTAGLGAIELPATQIIAKIARRRSAAIKDLRGGYLVDEDWHGKDPDDWLSAPRSEVAFVDGVKYMFLGSSVTDDPAHPVGRWVGDLLVRVPSSTHGSATFEVERRVLGGLDHAALQNDPRVYEELVRFLG